MNQLPTTEIESLESKIEGQSGPHRNSKIAHFICRILDFIIAAVFIYAGVLKIIDPVEFARDIDNYKMVPWPAAVAFAFYLPWLEVLCGVALIFRRFYSGSLLILTGLTIVFIVATVVAKARGLDISCGCFGHVSQGWSFGWHMVLDVALLAGLVVLFFRRNSIRPH
ncbi:MAG TPA: MauE/DoxX family redox-associated membrane protein [Chthoniobacterales bacterium]|nr:MauE/DoxX family redox-associated membrane protein [Chthoniobacterales bacterium]